MARNVNKTRRSIRKAWQRGESRRLGTQGLDTGHWEDQWDPGRTLGMERWALDQASQQDIKQRKTL